MYMFQGANIPLLKLSVHCDLIPPKELCPIVSNVPSSVPSSNSAEDQEPIEESTKIMEEEEEESDSKDDNLSKIPVRMQPSRSAKANLNFLIKNKAPSKNIEPDAKKSK